MIWPIKKWCHVPFFVFCVGFAQAAAIAEHGMVVTAQHLATKVGVDVLKKGGNAVDAAVAVGYALAVVYPAAGNLGGGGFMTIQLADGRKTFIDFREKAPLAANAGMYLDAGGNVIEALSLKGHLAAAVPGTVAGLEMAREKYGTRARGALIAPAIALAGRGFTLDKADADMLSRVAADFRDDPPSAAIFLAKGEPLAPGAKLVQRDLARPLRLVARRGRDGFYTGPVARAIAASSKAGKGLITEADLAQYAALERAPVECDYRGYHIVSAPPPSSGGTILCEMLNVLEGYSLQDLGYHTPRAMHVEIETMRHAYADRNMYLGDPDFVANPVDRLTSKEYAARIRAAIDPEKAAASQSIMPGSAPHEGTHTTHYSIIDKDGNAVAVTYTLNEWFGARVTAAGTGVLLNDEMDDFTAKLGVPNRYGLVQGQANVIAPGKRPLSSMAPTIVMHGGKPFMIVGTPGGSRIITVVMNTIVNVIDYGMTIQEAVDAPRFHQQWLPEATSVEPLAISRDTRESLERMGHRFHDSRPQNHVCAILVKDGRYYGANDPRSGSGLAAGY